jgi:chloride channel 3/4/5
LFPKYNLNDGKRREVLSASAASGVAVAFGSPLGGVLFSLEEVSYYFPPKTLFRTFFCCIVAALSLKFLNPYGTNKIVLFEVRYLTDWRYFELIIFVLLGIVGGLVGALFIKASHIWATTFRRIDIIKRRPVMEVGLVALVTGVLSFWNRYTRLAVAELLFELASPCDGKTDGGLCPKQDEILDVVGYLSVALIIKMFLTTITFGIKVPAGIYVPSMVVGGLMGRIVGHLTQYLVMKDPHFFLWDGCQSSGDMEACVTPGVYALVAAGATMCGVTRLSVTLAVILFELTGSLDHVLPFSLGVLCAKWTADAVEPLSIYDLLTDMNDYPYLDNRRSPVFDSELGDITPRFRRDKVIDITLSPLVKASDLRTKLRRLHFLGELDGGLPVLRDKILVGLIPAPDLEFALDRLENEDDTLCLLSTANHAHSTDHRYWPDFEETGYDSGRESEDGTATPGAAASPADLTPYIDPAPVVLDMHSPMNLVYQCFVKLGLRYVCVLNEGEFKGMVHKKAFVRYVKSLEQSEHQ